MRVLLPGQIVVTSDEGAYLRIHFNDVWATRGMTQRSAVCLIIAAKKTLFGHQWLLIVTGSTMGWLHSSDVQHIGDRPSLEAACRT